MRSRRSGTRRERPGGAGLIGQRAIHVRGLPTPPGQPGTRPARQPHRLGETTTRSLTAPMDLETGKPTYMTGTLPNEPRPTGSFPYGSPDRRLRIGPLPREGRRHCRGGVGLAPRPRPSRKLTCRSRSLELEQAPGAPGCGPGCRGFESPRSPHCVYRVTCGFDGSPKILRSGVLAAERPARTRLGHCESRQLDEVV